MTVRLGLFGTSWWADSMYLPAVSDHPEAEMVALCGRRSGPVQEMADRWGIPGRFTDPERMLSQTELDAVIIATANDSHRDLAVTALDAGLHVLCEKPLALNAAEAAEMVDTASGRAAITMVPFTYHYMPMNRWVHRLVSDGYVGRPHHVNLRYYTGYAFDEGYSWRFDRAIAGSGVIGDLGAHWVHLARWLLDDTETSVSAVTTNFIDRPSRPDGSAYDQTEDSVVMTVRYRSGAYGVLQASAVCWEGDGFGQSHQLEIHGDDGTIHARCDWNNVQEVRGLKRGEPGPPQVLAIPDDIWGSLRRDRVHDTYRDVFRSSDAMTRQWVSAIAAGETVRPDFTDGLAVQRVLDAAVASAQQDGCPISIDQTA
jgi:predicted dehydrogenase